LRLNDCYLIRDCGGLLAVIRDPIRDCAAREPARPKTKVWHKFEIAPPAILERLWTP
jgi:hypothetical protein